MVEQYIGHIITALVVIIPASHRVGVIKSQVQVNTKSRDDHEARLRLVETSRSSWESHVAEAGQVLDRLRNIEGDMREIRTDLTHRDRISERITDALEGNKMVLGELAEKIVRVETLMERNGNAGRG